LSAAPSAPKKSWKDHLLRSGLPLEHEVAKLLTNEGMYVEADHSFFRKEGTIYKEWSSDLTADWYSAPDRLSVEFKLSMLIECKYRSPEKSILLLEDPNSEMPLGTAGGTLIAFDHHVPFQLNIDSIIQFENKMPYAYKAIELHEGGAHEEDIRHGMQQLKYGSISSLKDNIEFSYFSHPEDMTPFFFCRILVTNSPIRVLNRDVGLTEIRNSNEYGEISHSVDFAIFYSSLGPDFFEHCQEAFRKDSNELLVAAKNIAARTQFEGKIRNYKTDAKEFVEDLVESQRWILQNLFCQSFIVNFDKLPKFLEILKLAASKSYKPRKLPKKIRTKKSAKPITPE
jgi:hypothetical protein